jgi:hypothetical protein
MQTLITIHPLLVFAMENRSQLRQESLTETRAATLATEETDGIVQIKRLHDDERSTKIAVKFEDEVPLEVDYLVRYQGFNISPRSRGNGIMVYEYSR